MDLPDFPEIPDVPGDPGPPDLFAPEFPALNLPSEAQANVEIPAADLPDFVLFDAI